MIVLCGQFKLTIVYVLKTKKALNMNRHISSLLIRSYSFHKHLTYGTIDFLDLYLRKKYFTRELPFPIERHTCQILKTFYCHSWCCFFSFFLLYFHVRALHATVVEFWVHQTIDSSRWFKKKIIICTSKKSKYEWKREKYLGKSFEKGKENFEIII